MKKVVLLILCLFVVGLFTTTYRIQKVGADSGFDTSYDSGGGSDWGGSDWDSSSGSDGDGGSLTLSGGISMVYLFGSLFGLAYVSSELDKKKKNKTKGIIISILYGVLIILINYLMIKFSQDIFDAAFSIIIGNIVFVPMLILMLIPKKKEKPIEVLDINEVDSRVKEAYEIYEKLQYAWSNFEYDKIKELVSDEMYNMYTNQLETLKVKNQKNVMSSISFVNGYVRNSKVVNNKEIVEINLTVTAHDYIKDITTNRVLRGNKKRLLTLSYLLTFERNIEVVKYCPQCGAKIDNKTVCPYCKSKIVNNSTNTKLVKKQMISQK